jgi:hypothetical protein
LRVRFVAGTAVLAAARLRGAAPSIGLPSEPFQVRRAFFASVTTRAMSSSLKAPLTPAIAASFMPCLMPSL